MNTDNTTPPDDGYRNAWKQAFDQASDTPPPRVWNAIERELDTENRVRIIPLWSQVRPWATGIAATVAIVLSGWWAWQTRVPTTTGLTVASRSSGPAQPVGKRPAGGPVLAAISTETASAGITLHKQELVHKPASELVQSGLPAQPGSTDRYAASAPGPITQAKLLIRSAATSPSVAPIATRIDGPELRRLFEGDVQMGRPPAPTGQTYAISTAALTTYLPAGNESDRLLFSSHLLAGKSFQHRQLTVQRSVRFQNEELLSTAESVQARSIKRQKWVSASIMPSSFNPAITTQQVVSGLAVASSYDHNTSVVSTRAPSFRSESGRGISVQVSVGAQLSNRWSVEAGIGYIQARSTVISPVLVAQGAGNTQKTLYTTLVQNAVGRNTTGASSSSKDNTYSSSALYDAGQEGRTRSDYRFVQVPVQVGYELRPRRKLGLAVLGGMITNLFVRNTVGETLDVKPADHLYQNVTLAGTAGARLRYRSSPRWSASVAGLYQRSLQKGTQSDAELETHPSAAGVSFGMDYHF